MNEELPPKLAELVKIAQQQIGKRPVPLSLTELLNAILGAELGNLDKADLLTAEQIAAILLARIRYARQKLTGVQVLPWEPAPHLGFSFHSPRIYRHPADPTMPDAHVVESVDLRSHELSLLAEQIAAGFEISICPSIATTDPLGVGIVMFPRQRGQNAGKNKE